MTHTPSKSKKRYRMLREGDRFRQSDEYCAGINESWIPIKWPRFTQRVMKAHVGLYRRPIRSKGKAGK